VSVADRADAERTCVQSTDRESAIVVGSFS
jgi:hypothetical protein